MEFDLTGVIVLLNINISAEGFNPNPPIINIMIIFIHGNKSVAKINKTTKIT